MAAKKKRKPLYQPPIAFARLQEMMRALNDKDDLSREMREEIRLTLEWLFLEFYAQEKQASGRKLQPLEVYLVHDRVRRGAQLKLALVDVLPAGTDPRTIATLKRAYSRYIASLRAIGKGTE